MTSWAPAAARPPAPPAVTLLVVRLVLALGVVPGWVALPVDRGPLLAGGSSGWGARSASRAGLRAGCPHRHGGGYRRPARACRARPAPRAGLRPRCRAGGQASAVSSSQTVTSAVLLRSLSATAATARGASVSVTTRSRPRTDAADPATRTVSPAPAPSGRRPRPGAPCKTARVQGRGPDYGGRGRENRACGRACGKDRSGSARGVPSGCATVRVARSTASTGVNVPLVTDTDAPRSVARAVEENRTVRLRPASGSRKRLSPAAGAASRLVARRWCGPHRERGTVTPPVSPCRCPSWRAPERLDSNASQLT